MPLYDFTCRVCGITFEALAAMDGGEAICACGGSARRLVSVGRGYRADGDWLASVAAVAEKDSDKPHVRAFLAEPSRANYRRWMRGEGKRLEAERMTLAETFASQHPDFKELAASGALAAQKRDNPLLDDVGAFFAPHLCAQRQAATEELAKARAEAATDAEARTLERVRSKRLATSLGASPAAPARSQGTDPTLAAPEKFGGINAVLAARLASRRRDAGL